MDFDESPRNSPKYLSSLAWLDNSSFIMTTWMLYYNYCERGKERRANTVAIKCFSLEVTHISVTHRPFGRISHVVFSTF